jgi:hypothetical protein
MPFSGFFAYPGQRAPIRDAILGAIELSRGERVQVTPWEEINVVGFKLDKLIRDRINAADFLAADITYPNCNVLYEIGYAASLGKPLNCGTSNIRDIIVVRRNCYIT